MTTLSCGHTIKNMDKAFSVVERDETRTGEACTSYSIICDKCLIEHIRWGIVKEFEYRGKRYREVEDE